MLRAIAHPVRTRILEELSASGPMRAADIARELGIPANQASFHLRQLAKYGLVEEAPEEARDKRDRVWKATAGAGYTVNAPRARRGAGRPCRLRRVPCDPARATPRARRPGVRHRPPRGQRVFATSDHALKLTDDEAGQLRQEIDDLVESWADRTRGRDPERRTYLLVQMVQPYPDGSIDADDRPSPRGDGPEPPRRAGSRGGGRRVGGPRRVCRREVRQGGRRAQRTRTDHLRRRPEPVGRPPRPRGRQPGAGGRPARRVLEGAVRRRLRRPARRGPGRRAAGRRPTWSTAASAMAAASRPRSTTSHAAIGAVAARRHGAGRHARALGRRAPRHLGGRPAAARPLGRRPGPHPRRQPGRRARPAGGGRGRPRRTGPRSPSSATPDAATTNRPTPARRCPSTSRSGRCTRATTTPSRSARPRPTSTPRPPRAPRPTLVRSPAAHFEVIDTDSAAWRRRCDSRLLESV